VAFWLEYNKKIRIDEVAAALKKMKRHKAPGLPRLVAEMIQATGKIGTHTDTAHTTILVYGHLGFCPGLPR